MKNLLKRFLATLLAVAVFVGVAPLGENFDINLKSLFSTSASAAVETYENTEIIFGDNGISRIEWLHDLTAIFSMTVKSDNLPDNYFSDLSQDSKFYKDAMLATEFGVVDIEAGGFLKPEEKVTREFAASTLNYCLGYIVESGVYTFSDSDIVVDDVSAQVSINRGWFALVGGKFNPDQTVSDAEIEKMILDAKTIVASENVDESFSGVYEFSDEIIVIPNEIPVSLDNDTITIYDSTLSIISGDIFAVYLTEIPTVYKALEVNNVNGNLVIKTQTINNEEVVSNAEDEGALSVGFEDFVPAEGMEATVIEDETSARTRSVVTNKKGIRLSATIPINEKSQISFVAKMTNLRLEYKFNVLKNQYLLKFTANIYLYLESRLDNILGAVGMPSSITLGEVSMPGIGSVYVSMPISLKGSAVFTETGKLTCGFQCNSYDGFRLLNGFEKDHFSSWIDLSGSIGFKAGIDVDILGIIRGSSYAEIGLKARYQSEVYGDGATPKKCETITAWLYAAEGTSITVGKGKLSKTFGEDKSYYDLSNSPVRIYYHFEDDLQVITCSRDERISYYTAYDSKYGSQIRGNRGYGRDGKPYTYYEYTLNEDENAILTKYIGNASIINIPEKIDGYTVVSIGDSLFKNNLSIHSVIIPDSVTEIRPNAFRGCSNLVSVKLSDNLQSLGSLAFDGCESLTSVNIPKSLTETTEYMYNYYRSEPFRGCLNLKTVTFEEGITKVVDQLFEDCDGIEEIVIPDTVTEIAGSAFKGCDNLRKITFPKSLTTIAPEAFKDCFKLSDVNLPPYLVTLGCLAFDGCESLTSVNIPKSLTETTEYMYNYYRSEPFRGCLNLKTVTFEEGITKVVDQLFEDCDGIEEIVIPDTVTEIAGSAFKGCDNLRKITFPKSLTTIAPEAFKDCFKLSDVNLPPYLVTLGCLAFDGCESLTSVNIPKSLTETTEYMYNYYRSEPFRGCLNLKTVTFEEGITKVVDQLFEDCDGIEEIVIPDTVTEIAGSAFKGCDNLRKITFPKSLTTIAPEAFKDCFKLSDVNLPPYLVTLGCLAFDGCESLTSVNIPKSLTETTEYMYNYYRSEPFRGCLNLKTVTFEEGITKVVDQLFEDCDGIEEIVIPDTVTEIAGSAFRGCDNLKKVTIPESVVRIEDFAFYDCISLESVIILDSVTKIGYAAFCNCISLGSATLSSSIVELPEKTFANCGIKSIDIPDGVLKLGNSVFAGCEYLELVKLPKNITEIPKSAF